MGDSSAVCPEKKDLCASRMACAQRRRVLPRRSKLSNSHLVCRSFSFK